MNLCAFFKQGIYVNLTVYMGICQRKVYLAEARLEGAGLDLAEGFVGNF